MTAVARLLEQRSVGELRLRMERDGIAVMQEQGSLKCRLPQGSQDAILINTSGGLAGGDRFSVMAEAGEGADLAITSQAAEHHRLDGKETAIVIEFNLKRALKT